MYAHKDHRTENELLLLKLTCINNLTEIVIKSVDIANYMKYFHFMVSVPPHFRWDLEIEGWFKKRELRKFVTLGWDPKFKGGAVILKDTMRLESISFSL